MFINYAHRGASHYAPDSTITAFDMGLKMNANGIETDLHKTKDGHIVLFHNDYLDGRSSGTGPLKEHTLAELKELDLGSWKDPKYAGEKIVTLEEFAKRYFHLNLTFALELKAADCEKETLEIVKKYKAEDKVIITSFHFEYIQKTRELDKNIRIGWLVREVDEEKCKQLKTINGTQMCPQAAFVTKETVDLINSCGFRTRVWGIGNDVELMKKVCALDIDGMTCNYPDVLYDYLKETNSVHLY